MSIVHRRPAARRGMLLLVALGMLAMFSLIAITFVVIASHNMRAAKALKTLEQQADPPHRVTDRVLLQSLRGVNGGHSVIGPHGLLEDMYSLDSLRGHVFFDPVQPLGQPPNPRTLPTSLPPGQNAQFLEFGTDIPAPVARRRVGCVLTMLVGPAAGRSTRIVGYGSNRFRVVAFEGVSSAAVAVYPYNIDPSAHYIVNAPAFAGTGFGFNPSSTLPNALLNQLSMEDLNGDGTMNPLQYALLPNPAAFVPSGPYTDPAGPGGANEDWDAPDFQNMLLGMILPYTDLGALGSLPSGTVPIPSLHRPALIRYWMTRVFDDPTFLGFSWPGGLTDPLVKWTVIWNPYGADGIPGNADDPAPGTVSVLERRAIVNLKRKIILRPLQDDHPNFDGGNPVPIDQILVPRDVTGDNIPDYFWDVDTNGDGMPDAIWVDVGLPVRQTADGRKYKPLAAILCVDLDGRINLNAAGATEQLARHYRTNAVVDPANPTANPLRGPFAGSFTPLGGPAPAGQLWANLPARGEGFGPADVRLEALGLNVNTVSRLFWGDPMRQLEGRYGETRGAAPAGAGVTDNLPDALSQLFHFEYPLLYAAYHPLATPLAPRTAFSNPPDLWGRMAVGIDFRGQPYYWAPFDIAGVASWAGDLAENPYEMNLSRKGSRPASGGGAPLTNIDNPFSVGELERILRSFDRDSGMLPDRLRALLGGAGMAHQVTVESWHTPSLPAKSAFLPDFLYDPRLMAPEILAHLPMDVNRPFGDGRDDTLPGNPGVGTVDEPLEGDREGVAVWGGVPFHLANGIDVNNDTVSTRASDQYLARQLYARHLFVLLMWLDDAGYEIPLALGTTDDTDFPAGSVERRALTVRRLAQWAINAADFRDADSIMTAFEYDADPFTDNDGNGFTWDVDGDLSTPEAIPQRRVVWGCEYPELLLGDTTAFHDRRIADTAHDSGSSKLITDGDPNADQTRIPQGSAFFELYCTGNATNPTPPAELYFWDGADWKLDLARLAPADGAGLEYPVWRLAISDSRLDATSGSDNDVAARAIARPDSFSFEPEQYNTGPTPAPPSHSLLPLAMMPGGESNVEIDRIVWFCGQQPTTHLDSDRTFYNKRGGAALLGRGRYAVAGPRDVTYVGSMATNIAGDYGAHAPQEVRLAPIVTTTDLTGTSNYPTADPADPNQRIQPPLGIVLAADPPADPPGAWTDADNTAPGGIGLNISEPLPQLGSYYPEPGFVSPDSGTQEDAYGDASALGLYLDTPLEQAGGQSPGKPISVDGIVGEGTTEDYKTVFLQRLADPTIPYHPVTNPYLTIDRSSIDLTVFNGEASFAASPTEPDDPADPVHFGSRQRGGVQPNIDFNLWSQYTEPAEVTNPGVAANVVFKHELVHTLGFLNKAFHNASPQPQDFCLTKPDFATAPQYQQYIGDPVRPFPWLCWNNRPYATPQEVTLVPATSPSRLLWRFSLSPTVPGADTPYAAEREVISNNFLPFGHLANFYFSDPAPGDPVPAHAPSPMARLLDYLRVPSRFVGTETFFNPDPAFFGNESNADTMLFRPPFNRISHYRDPGLVNINTITSAAVWNAIQSGHAGPPFDLLVESRRGYDAATQMMLEPDPACPTYFANPIRSLASAGLVPAVPSMRRTRSVNASLLRAAGVSPNIVTETNRLFQHGNPAVERDYNRSGRNAYFYYQHLKRLGNLTTTRSNVYAIWITVGNFEVEKLHPLPPGTGYNPAVYPDGYTLGREIGAETGEITRHRAFYIIDRSIPVAFQRGMDNNVEDTVLLRRYIE